MKTPFLDALLGLTDIVQNDPDWIAGFRRGAESMDVHGLPAVAETIQCWAENNPEASPVPLHVQGYAEVVRMHAVGRYN